MGNKFALLVQEAAKSKEAPKIEVRSKKLKASVDNYLSKIIKTLPQLEQCIIKSCKLKAIPNDISALENLVSLVLEDAGLSDLPKVQLKKIQRISLRKNQIVQMPSLILNSQSITHVDISFNLITELPDQLSTLNNLVELNLEGNCFSKFPRVVLSLTKLTSLNLTSCGVGSIPAEIVQLVNLQQLFLNANNLKKFPIGFQQLIKLEHLELASNNFEVFPKKIFSLTNLTKLNLAHNKIKRLPHSQLPQLSKLIVFKVNDNALDRLPSTIKLLSELKELYVHENQIEALPKNIHRCMQLNILRAEYNKISDVPAKMKQLEKLTVLMLHNNSLTTIPSALLDSNFLKHVFTVSLDDNPLPESVMKTIKEKGSRIYLLDNAAEKSEGNQDVQSSSSNNNSVEVSISLPEVPLLGRKYDTVGRSSSAGSSSRRRKLSDVVAMSHSSSSLPVVTPTVSESASAPTSPNKAKRRSIRSLSQIKEAEASNNSPSPTRTRNFTVTSQKESSKDKQERSLTASSPDLVRRRKSTSLSLSDVELGFLEELKGVVPPYSKFREAFESLLETQDLSENRKEQLKRMKDADKWRVLRLYKGDTISLLLDNKPKKKNKERDEMMSLIDGLKSDDISYLKRLHELLVQSDAQLYLFVDTGGVPLLVDLLQQAAMTPRETNGLKDRHIEVLGCLLGLAETTIKTLLTTPNLVSSILACLDIDDDTIMRLSVTLLEIITAVDPEIGPKLLVEGLVQLKKRRKSPFLTSPIASLLKTKNIEIRAMSLAIINEILDSNESLIERCRLRNEITKLVTSETFRELEKLADENEQVKVVIDHFNESRQEDEEDLKSASASDVNVMISINATEDVKTDDGPEKKPSGSSLLASLSRARVAGDRKPFKVVVTDVAGTGANSYMMMYTDDTTVQELIDKVMGRLPAEQLKPLQNNKCGLFIIPDNFRDGSPNSLTDSIEVDNGPESRPPSEGSFADPTNLVTSVASLTSEGLGYLKLLPWKITIHCNVGESSTKRVVAVEADPFTLLSEFVLRTAKQLALPSDDEYVLAVLKLSSNVNEQRADPEHDENEEIQTRALKSLSDKNTGFDGKHNVDNQYYSAYLTQATEVRLLDTKPLMFYQHEMHAGELHLKPKPEVVKVMFNDETYVNIEVYARDLVKDVLVAINDELKGTSMRDYGLVLETKTQANDTSVHSEWLEPDRTLRSYTDPFKNKYRLRYTSQPQDVFIKIIDEEKKFTVNLDEKISEIIYYVCKTENYSGTYSLYMNDKLLNRRQSLKEAGVAPGDHLILKEESTITEEGSRAAIDEDDVNIYDEGDGDKFICYEQKTSPLNNSRDNAGKMEIEHATLNKLVARVTDADNYDANFQDIFIFTYRSFTSPDMLLHKLIQRYSTKDKVSDSVAERIRVRAIFFVCQWLERDYHNLDKSVVEKLMIFIETTVGHERGQQLLKILDRVRKTKPESPNLSLPPVAFKFKGTIRTPKLIDLDEVTIARQLTLDVWRIYARIKPEEFFDQAWAKPSLQHLAPNVLKLITSFNYYSNWVASEIVMEKKLRQRRVLVAKVIKIAQILREMNNYHLAYALITGLNNVAVSRLKWTLEKLGRAPKLMLQNLEQLMGMEGSFKNYRDSVSGVSGVPCVPYIGVTLKDMTFVEDGNPNMIGELINWAKRKLIYTVVANFLRFNKIDYIIEPIIVSDDYPIERLIKEASQLNDDELFEHSLQCEPRGAKPHQLT